MPSMIAIVHSTYSQSVHAPASHAGLMDNEAERYCTTNVKSVLEALNLPLYNNAHDNHI